MEFAAWVCASPTTITNQENAVEANDTIEAVMIRVLPIEIWETGAIETLLLR
jgi:hypothetical protein